MRRAHFPPERNYLSAHVTLFHALPPSGEGELRDLLARLAAATPAPAAVLDRIISLGRGTALHLASPGMLDLRQQIADRFHGMMTAQDCARPRLHITVQNKVSPELARALQAELATSFQQRHFTFAGLGLHAYMGGPWQPLGRWSFRGK